MFRSVIRVYCRSLVTLTIGLGILSGYVTLSEPALAAQGSLIRVSASQSGVQADNSSTGGLVSADGRYVVFTSDATNLVPGDTNAREDIFRYDRVTGQLQPVSVTAAGSFLSANHGGPVISGDGRYVAFWSEGVFDSADSSKTPDVLLKDMATGVVERLTLAPDGSTKIGEDRFSPNKPLGMSDDGRWVAFQSGGTNLVAGDTDDGQLDVYIRDRFTGFTTLLSTEPSGLPGPSSGLDVVVAGSGAEAVVGFRVLSPDRSTKRMVVRNLLSGIEQEVVDVDPQKSTFLGLAAGGSKAIISTGPDSVPVEYDVTTKQVVPLPNNVDWSTIQPSAFSADLRFYVAPFPTSDSPSFRVVDRVSGQISDSPFGPGGVLPNQGSIPTSISDDGTVIAFSSLASNLVFGDTNGLMDSFVVKIAKGRFGDDDGNPFEADIEWLAAEGITMGCDFDLFCPDTPVTREQMASFLVRALGLPASTVDAFSDDGTSPHQADINSLAAAGITQGCGPGLFCPTNSVSRQEMASFIVRTLELPESSTDFFTDDSNSIHESDINALAQAKVTLGCAPGLYCPIDSVLRGQMAAFLHRALG